MGATVASNVVAGAARDVRGGDLPPARWHCGTRSPGQPLEVPYTGRKGEARTHACMLPSV
jgi:hypothetical protein